MGITIEFELVAIIEKITADPKARYENESFFSAYEVCAGFAICA